MAPKSNHSFASTLAGSGFLALILWIATLAVGILVAMFRTSVGKTTALFNTVFFEAMESSSGTELSLGLESFPRALALFVALWLITACASFLIHSIPSHRDSSQHTEPPQ